MPFVKGQSGNPAGRKPGAKNKVPKDLIDAVLQIAEKLDAEGKGLKDCAGQDPKWFYENFIKHIIPKNVDVNLDGEIVITWQK